MLAFSASPHSQSFSSHKHSGAILSIYNLKSFHAALLSKTQTSLLVLRFLLTNICQTEQYQTHGYKQVDFCTPSAVGNTPVLAHPLL